MKNEEKVNEKPILKVVRGNRERRKEVIELLENLGGKKRVYDAVQKPICPQRQTERKVYKKIDDKQLSIAL